MLRVWKDLSPLPEAETRPRMVLLALWTGAGTFDVESGVKQGDGLQLLNAYWECLISSS